MQLVLDSSGSMSEPAAGGQSKIAAAKGALRTVVDGLPDEAQVGLRVYGATVFSRNDPGACTDSQEVVPPGTDNRDELRSAIASYKPYGETPIAHALQEAGKDLGSEGHRTIVLVSDGEATCPPSPCVVARQLARGRHRPADRRGRPRRVGQGPRRSSPASPTPATVSTTTRTARTTWSGRWTGSPPERCGRSR